MPRICQSELTGYAAADWNVIDYRMWRPFARVNPLRGPEIEQLDPGQYIAVIGAAQTFGRFCERPFPAIVAERTEATVLNMGMAGAGPRLFLRPQHLSLINDAALVIVQVFSGRSLGNSVFECPDHGGQLRRRDRGPDAKKMLALDAWRQWMDELDADTSGNQGQRIGMIKSLVEETRTLWVGEMALMREAIKPPCVLMWFSKRELDYVERYSHPELVFGEFPHLVNGRMMKAIQPLFQDYVEVVTSRGSPEPLFNRFTGEPHVVDPSFKHPASNAYYPSSAMHEDAADTLIPVIERMLNR